MTDRPAEPQPDESVAVRTQELLVEAAVWKKWDTSARSANDAALFWGATAALIAGLLSAGVGVLLSLHPSGFVAVLIFAPLVGWAVWSIVSARVRRRYFQSNADEMRSLMVPDLLRHPSNDELRTLAATGNALLRKEYAVARVEDRLNLFAVHVVEFAPERLPWGGGTESGGLSPGVG
jgi:hypothetical protein